jgi:hypothetical protein
LEQLDACRQLEDVYQQQQRCAVKNMVDYFTANGYLSKRKARGKSSKAKAHAAAPVSPSQEELEVHEI